MDKFKKITINILVFIFFVHGILYFITPTTSYSGDNPFKIIKYIVMLLILCIFFISVNYKKWIAVLCVGILSVLLIFAVYLFANDMSNIGLFITYIFPFIMIFIISEVVKYVDFKKISVAVYLIATVMAYFNTYILKGIFTRWHVSGDYREVSIFINPNNFGIMISLLLILFLIFYRNIKVTTKTIAMNIGLIINSFILIRMSGSNTAIIIFMVTLVYYLFILISHIQFKNVNKKKITVSVILVFLILIGIFLLFRFVFTDGINVRSISLKSGFIRINTYKEFIYSNLNNLVFPYRHDIVYVDNIYLSLWGNLGLPILIVFILYNIYLVKLTLNNKRIDQTFILFVFSLIGITTNYLYLWPMGYIYWGISTLIFNDNKNDV